MTHACKEKVKHCLPHLEECCQWKEHCKNNPPLWVENCFHHKQIKRNNAHTFQNFNLKSVSVSLVLLGYICPYFSK